jgi:hypothetical protein
MPQAATKRGIYSYAVTSTLRRIIILPLADDSDRQFFGPVARGYAFHSVRMAHDGTRSVGDGRWQPSHLRTPPERHPVRQARQRRAISTDGSNRTRESPIASRLVPLRAEKQAALPMLARGVVSRRYCSSTTLKRAIRPTLLTDHAFARFTMIKPQFYTD